MKFNSFKNVLLKSLGILSTFNAVFGYQIQYKFHCFEDYNSICKEYEDDFISIASNIKNSNILSRDVNFEVFVDSLSGISHNGIAVNLDSNFEIYSSKEKYPNYKKMSSLIGKKESLDMIMIFDNFKNNQGQLNGEFFSLYNEIDSHWRNALPTINAFDYNGNIRKLEEQIFPNNSLFHKLEQLLSKNSVTKKLYESLVKSYDIDFLSMIYDNEQNLYELKPEPIHWNNTLIVKVDDHKQLTGQFDRVVAVGDIHGDYNKLVQVLTAAKLIDKKLNWIAEDTALVQLGDLIDRARNPIQFFINEFSSSEYLN